MIEPLFNLLMQGYLSFWVMPSDKKISYDKVAKDLPDSEKVILVFCTTFENVRR